jgi:Mg2+-importing ATPase
MVSMALATPFLPFLPLTATQVLLTNFLTDLPLMAIATDNVDAEWVAEPQRWRVQDVQAYMVVFGLLSSVFDLVTFFLLGWVFHVDEKTFQTTWFVVSVLTELLVLMILRTRRPVWRSRPGRWIIWLSVFVAAAAVGAPLIPAVAGPLGLQPGSAAVMGSALAVVVAYGAATEVVKARFFRRRAERRAHR